MGCGEAAHSVHAYLGLLYVAGLAVHCDLAREEALRRLPLEYGSDADLVVGVGLQDLPRLRRAGVVSELGEQHTLHHPNAVLSLAAEHRRLLHAFACLSCQQWPIGCHGSRLGLRFMLLRDTMTGRLSCSFQIKALCGRD